LFNSKSGHASWVWLLILSWLSSVSADEILFLEIVVNNKNTGHLVEVIRKDNDWEMMSSDLLIMGITAELPEGQRILLSSLPGLSVIYDEVYQRLFITVPSSMLPLQSFSTYSNKVVTDASRRDKGAFINYNFLAIDDEETGSQSSLWHEVYWFSNSYYIMSNGLQQYGATNERDSGYVRFDTFYQKDNEDELWSVTLGDVINAAPNWGRSIRMGGIRIARDYALDPNLITYPLPEFYGESALPGSIDVLINDQLRWRDEINPGPFMIDTMPHISGAGVAEIITTDLQGQQARKTLNFYVASELLAQGMLDYDLTLGYRRENFGLRSDNYAAKPVFSGSVRYGLNSFLTPQFLVQGGEDLYLGGAGLTFLAGNYGVFDVSHVSSKYFDEKGDQYGIGYSYSEKRIGFSSRYLKRLGHYRDLGAIDRGVMRDSQLQLAFSIHGDELGSFNLGYFRLVDPDAGAREFMSLSWSRYFQSGLTIFSNINHQLSGNRDNVVSFTLSMPLGREGQAGVTTVRDVNSNWRTQVQGMRNAPYSGGVGWRAAIDDSDEGNGYAAVDWRGDYSDLSASVYRSGGRKQYTGEVAGALILMEKDFYMSRTVVDSFALVDAGQRDVPVLIGNQLVGETNVNGKLLVPDLYSYLENRVAIDPAQLPANASIDSIEQKVVPRRKGGVHLRFPLVFSQSAIIEAYLPDQKPLPVGAVLNAANYERDYVVGWNGEVYIEDLSAPLNLYWEGGNCVLNIEPLTDTSLTLPRLGKIICQPVGEGVE
jgi:outer membrane usher protein